MFARLARMVLADRLLWSAVFLALFFGVFSGSAHLYADFSVKAFFARGDPELDYLNAYQKEWGPDDRLVLVVITQGSESETLLTSKRLETIQRVTDALAAMPSVARARSITNVALLDGQETIDLTPVIETLPTSTAALATWRSRLLQTSLFVPYLLAPDGRVGAIAVELDRSSDDVLAIQPVVADLRVLLKEVSGENGLHFTAAGLPAVRADFFSQLFHDQTVFVPITVFLAAILLLFTFRRLHGLFAPLLAAGVPVMMLFGAMGFTDEPVGILNQSYFTLLPSIALADAIHLVSRFHEEARQRLAPGERLTKEIKHAALVAAVSQVGGACLLTSLTTAIGFISLCVADMSVLNNFGAYAAIGIVLSYATVLIIIPLTLSLSRGVIPDATREDQPTRVDQMLSYCARLSTDRPNLILALTSCFVLVALYFGSQVVADNKISVLLQPEHPTSLANRVADRKLAGLSSIEIDLSVSGTDSLLDPMVLTKLYQLEKWALEQPGVMLTIGPGSYIAALNRVMTSTEAVPATRPAVAQLMLLAEGDDHINSILNDERTRGRMQIRITDPGGKAFTAFTERMREETTRLIGDAKVDVHLTGVSMVAYRGINNITLDLRNSLLIAFLVIGAIIGLLFRNLRIALICFVPNALPLLAGYGFLGVMDWLLDPSAAVIFTLALAIAVDDTIHLMVRVREEQRNGLLLEAAIQKAVLRTGRAVTITSVVLCVCFSVYWGLSSFPTMEVLGGLGFVIIFVAWLCDLFLLPALLARFGK